MKKQLLVFIILCALLSSFTLALDKLTGYVNDEAGIISPEYEASISADLDQLRQNTSIEMAVATVKSLGGVPIEEYSLNLAHKVLGDAKKDNGILILLAVEEREYRIEVGYGLEPIISAPLAGRIGREYMEPYFKKGNYEEGLYMGVYAIKGVIQNDGSWETEANPANNNVSLMIFFVILAIFLAILAFGFYEERRLLRQRKRSKKDAKHDHDFAAAQIAAVLFSGRGGGSSGGGSGGFGGFSGGSFGGGGFSGKF